MRELEATQLRNGKWAVRPKGQLGTCGFYPVAWHVVFVKAATPKQAITKAGNRIFARIREKITHTNRI